MQHLGKYSISFRHKKIKNWANNVEISMCYKLQLFHFLCFCWKVKECFIKCDQTFDLISWWSSWREEVFKGDHPEEERYSKIMEIFASVRCLFSFKVIVLVLIVSSVNNLNLCSVHHHCSFSFGDVLMLMLMCEWFIIWILCDVSSTEVSLVITSKSFTFLCGLYLRV